MNLIPIPSECDNIHLDSAIYIDTSLSESIDITIGENVACKYFFYSSGGNRKRTFSLASGASIDVRGIIIGTNIESQLSFIIEGTNIKAHMDILAFAQSNSAITIKGNANVSPGSREIDVRVDQTNILIGTHSFVRGMPVLEVATDDVVGGHSCKMHRISGEGLFYLESHGIDTKHAESMLIQSEIWKRLAIIQGTEEATDFCSAIFDQLRKGRPPFTELSDL